MTKIQPQFEKSRKVSGPRALQPSQVSGNPVGNLLDISFLSYIDFWIEHGDIVWSL
jgi:hypothetical protein